MKSIIRAALAPRSILAFVAGLALLILLASLTDIRETLSLVILFPRELVFVVIALFMLYNGIKFCQWHFLVSFLSPEVSCRKALVAFAGGEASRAVPGSIYFKAYMLQRLRGPRFAVSAGATTAMIAFEVEAALFLLLLLGVGPWAWVRPAVLAVIAAVLVLVLVFRRASPPISLMVPAGHYRKELMDGTGIFVSSLKALLTPKSLPGGFVLGLFYLLAAALALYFISQGIVPGSTGVLEVTSVYAVSVIASLLSPVPFDIGITEGSGLIAFVAFGTSKEEGLAAMLILRVLSTLTAFVFAAAILLWLRRELREAPGNQETARAK